MNSEVTVPADGRLKPIRTPEEHRAALTEIDRLFGSAPGTPEGDRLEVLAILIADYERKNHPMTAPDPITFLSVAMDAQGRSQADLARLLGSRSRASEVLNRRRHLTAEMIARLVNEWKLPAAILSAPYAVTGGVRRAVMRGAAAVAVLAMVLTAGTGLTLWAYSRDLPSAADLASYTPADLAITDAGGQIVKLRRFAPLSAIPAHVVKAFLAAEDQDYYAHSGYSLAAMVRAAMQNLAQAGQGKKPAGAATITQQLAKNLYFADQPPSLARKAKEVVLAWRIEQALPKSRILELYLNEIYFGGKVWGIVAAAQHYFGKEPADLSVAEAAYLAALPKAPNQYRLDVAANIGRATERRNWVLARMADDGLITATAAEFARQEALTGNAALSR
jgi:penicillin-binding protein 1A